MLSSTLLQTVNYDFLAKCYFRNEHPLKCKSIGIVLHLQKISSLQAFQVIQSCKVLALGEKRQKKKVKLMDELL